MERRLEGKRIAFLGDSITEGVGASSSDKCYVSVFRALTGATVFNCGIGGTRIAVQKNKTVNSPEFDRYFASRIAAMPPELDYVVVFGGTNDFGHGDAPLGAFGDDTTGTFYGAVRRLYLDLYEKYPTARIVAALPLHRLGEECKGAVDGVVRTESLFDYVNAIRQTAELFSIPVVDLYAASNMQPQVEPLRALYMPDGLHPSDLGHRRLAEIFANFLERL